MAAEAAIGHDPPRHTGQAPQQRHGLRRLVRLAGRYAEGDRAARGVGDHDGLGAEAATFEALPRTAKRLTRVALRRCRAFFAAPAVFWWARIEVPSRAGGMPPAMPNSTSRSCAMASRRSQTPSRDQRMNVCAGRGQCPRPTTARGPQGSPAASPRSRAARGWPRSSGATPSAAPSRAGGTPPPAAPASTIARPSAPRRPPQRRHNARPTPAFRR